MIELDKDKNEKIIIDVVKDKFSSSEISKLAQCIKDIEQNRKHGIDRHIVWNDGDECIRKTDKGLATADHKVKITHPKAR